MTKNHLCIVTGASRGLGQAIAERLIEERSDLLCISRSANPSLQASAEQRGIEFEQWCHDLAEAEAVATRLRVWLASRASTGYSTVTLVNNAAALARIAPLSAANLHDLARALRVGLEAPMMLSSVFLEVTESWPQRGLQRRLLNISSGLGRRAMASQSGYCAIKAAVDHFTRCVALEEALKPHGARVCSLAPGVIDTDMQTQLRSAQAESFPDRGNFMSLKDRGMLSSPHEAAARVLAYLARPDFGSQPVDDVRN